MAAHATLIMLANVEACVLVDKGVVEGHKEQEHMCIGGSLHRHGGQQHPKQFLRCHAVFVELPIPSCQLCCLMDLAFCDLGSFPVGQNHVEYHKQADAFLVSAFNCNSQIHCIFLQCNLKHVKHKHVYFFWTIRDADAVQYFNSTFAVICCPVLLLVLCLHTALLMRHNTAQ